MSNQKQEQPSIKYLSMGLFIYISTGIAQPLLIDTLRMNSLLGHKYLLLPTLANTTGMALCGLLASKSQWNNLRLLLRRKSNSNTYGGNSSNSLRRMILITSVVDLLSGMCLTFGILLTGGAIFVVLYNSCPAWTAILSKLLLGKKMTLLQFVGVILVCIGLVANVLGTKVQIDNDNGNGDYSDRNGADSHNHIIRSMATTPATNDEDRMDDTTSFLYEYGVLFGSIIVLLGSLLHSLMFVLSDISLRSIKNNNNDYDRDYNHNSLSPSKAIKMDDLSSSSNNVKDSTTMTPAISTTATTVSGEIWSCCLGTIEATFMTLWVLIGILTTGFNDDSRLEETIMDQSNKHSTNDVDIVAIIGGFLLLVIVDTAHAAAFFTLLKNIGAVASALLKGVQTVIVIALSAVFFCPSEQSQCLNTVKVCSACLVLTGVFCYGIGGRDSSAASPDDMRNKKGNCHAISISLSTNYSQSSDRITEMKNLI